MIAVFDIWQPLGTGTGISVRVARLAGRARGLALSVLAGDLALRLTQRR
jgi:hypothetical protein